MGTSDERVESLIARTSVLDAALNRIAVLRHVERDDSYSNAGMNAPLRTLTDSNPEIDFLDPSTLSGAGITARRSGYSTDIEGWRLNRHIPVPATGFSVSNYQSDDKRSVIVAL